MSIILTLTLPFFAVAGLGYLAARSGLLEIGAVRSLNVFVFYFAMPALVIRALGRQSFESLVEPAYLLGWLTAAVLIFLVGALAARMLFSASLGEMAIAGQSSAVGNLGFLALPLMIAAYGEKAVGPIASSLIIDLVIMIPLSLALLEAARGAGGAIAAAKRAFRGAIVNPFLISIVVGLALSFSGIGLPEPLDRFTAFLSGAAGPAALFSLGLTLAGRRVEGAAGAIALMTVLKLAVHPVAVFATLSLFGVPPDMRALGVVIAAMPIAGNVFVIAEQYGAYPRRASAAILISTVLAVFTVAAALAWAGAVVAG